MMYVDGIGVVCMNELDRNSLINTLVAMCENMAKDIADHDGRSVNDVLADAYLDSGRDIWHETFSAVVKAFNNK